MPDLAARVLEAKKKRCVECLSLGEYLKSELHGDYCPEIHEEKYKDCHTNVINLFRVPYHMEKFLGYGILYCLDAFLYTFTSFMYRFCFAFCTAVSLVFKKFLDSNNRSVLTSSATVVLLKGIILLSSCLIMGQVDTSIYYHLLKTQSTLKITYIFILLDVLEKLVSTFGRDFENAFIWSVMKPRGR